MYRHTGPDASEGRFHRLLLSGARYDLALLVQFDRDRVTVVAQGLGRSRPGRATFDKNKKPAIAGLIIAGVAVLFFCLASLC